MRGSLEAEGTKKVESNALGEVLVWEIFIFSGRCQGQMAGARLLCRKLSLLLPSKPCEGSTGRRLCSYRVPGARWRLGSPLKTLNLELAVEQQAEERAGEAGHILSAAAAWAAHPGLQ